MSMLLFSSDFTNELLDAIENASNELVICSAFVKTQAIQHLLRDISEDVTVSIIARWAKQDLVFGASDLGVYQWCQSKGYRFGVNSKLHAKLYSIDQSLIFLGSANLTHRGLSISGTGNLEIGTCIDPTDTDMEKFRSFINDEVVWLDDNLYQTLSAEIDASQDVNSEANDDVWSADVIAMLRRSTSHLWVSELLFTSPKSLLSPNFELEEIVHDFELLNLNIDNFDANALKLGFMQTRLFQWLRDTAGINNAVRFGWLTNELHNALLDDATPYRSEIKEFVVIIFDWFKFMPEIFEVTRFNVSEKVSIKE
jgi:phosphatidylserine/phosphatidylglycerophosphate/cardiolipin synthase-like enzyme